MGLERRPGHVGNHDLDTGAAEAGQHLRDVIGGRRHDVTARSCRRLPVADGGMRPGRAEQRVREYRVLEERSVLGDHHRRARGHETRGQARQGERGPLRDGPQTGKPEAQDVGPDPLA